MPSRAPYVLLLLLLLLWRPVAVRADATLGIEPIFFAGKHLETGNNVSGTAAGAFLEGTVRSGMLGLHVEGIPAIHARATSSDQFGRLTESIGLFTADVRGYLDPARRFYLSVGEAVFTQTTPVLFPREEVFTDSRVVGARFGAGTRLVWGTAFVEGFVVGSAGLRGRISYRGQAFQTPDQSEQASEVDASLAYGRRLGRRFEILGGIRNINYSAVLTNGTAADRNVATGVFVEGRIRLGR